MVLWGFGSKPLFFLILQFLQFFEVFLQFLTVFYSFLQFPNGFQDFLWKCIAFLYKINDFESVWISIGGPEWIWLDLNGSGWIWVDIGGSEYIYIYMYKYTCMYIPLEDVGRDANSLFHYEPKRKFIWIWPQSPGVPCTSSALSFSFSLLVRNLIGI